MVRLIATDIRGLADTTFTTATVRSASDAIADAVGAVHDLVVGHVLDEQDGKWLTNKLGLAGKLLSRPVMTPAVNQLQEVAQRLDGGNTPALLDSIRRIIESLKAE
jgi:hypothetical protein